MRETFVSIIALFAIVEAAGPSELGKDGFNYYKDYLRARSDEMADSGYDDRALICKLSPITHDKIICLTNLDYFRTPLQLYPEIPAIQEHGKRTANLFKNHMLNKEVWPGGGPNKRTSKTGLSLLMQSKQDVRPS
ncbi:unnamed protein product [Leptosia nina]|uniref:Uncharacterized protein n=1 Tax=Leptosia nina TaxID=320188 RepID=A0AAV1J5P6_9NEOP